MSSTLGKALKALRAMFGQTVEQKTYQPESVALPFRTRRPHVQFPLESTAEEVRSGSLVHDAGKQRNFPLVNADGEVVQSKDSQTVEKEVSDPKDAAQSKSDVEHPTSATARTSPSGAEQSSFDEGKSGFLASRKRFKTIKPHIPMIRFRKGGPDLAKGASGNPASSGTSPSMSGSPGHAHAGVASPAALEWWMIPDKYRRRDIDDLECDIINMGGREKPFE